ncbi:MAG: hypothetical protein AVDCRST_MAG07-2508 [uncultured Frankineae bacterium]|uniref:NAD(P)-binding domain-containing protein n=1 Tax=uncultured Frankineae bacterium TaxID=437475 RepID=A0A6J4LN45_9ACTN|nr:MAG: hypothetical protein AVDCRST_MAG07-2508 [uncultured Frankineae bacterium]
MSLFLVLGGTGKTGRRVLDLLTAQGHTARAAARTPGPAADSVEPVRFDWDDPATHDPALAGASAVYVVPPALRTDHPPLIADLARRAADAGVQRLVLLSARGVDAGPDNPLRQAEAAVATAGLPVTVVRPTWFMQNFTESFFAPGVADGAVVAPTGSGAEPFIDAADIAAVAAAALTGEVGPGAYDLSGPQALTFAEAAAVLGGRTGRPVVHVDLPVEQWVAGAGANGVPDGYAAMLGALFGLIRDGSDAHLSDGVSRALGRPPTSFADWAAREVHPPQGPGDVPDTRGE